MGSTDYDYLIVGSGFGGAVSAAIPANLGVNPSLTITALAERFAARQPASPNTTNILAQVVEECCTDSGLRLRQS